MIIRPSLVASLYSMISVSDSIPAHFLKKPMFTLSISNANLNVVVRSGIADSSYSLVAPPPCHWLIWKITNSAGFTGAMPTSTINLPSSTEFFGLFVSSQMT